MSQSINTIVTCVHDDTRLAGIPFELGRKHLKRNWRPPRVVWVPVSATFLAPEDPGGRFNVAQTARNKQTKTRMQTFEVHIQHCDIGETEGLVDDVVASIQAAAFGSAEFGTATWFTQTASGADFATDGEKVVLEVTFKVPVIEEIATTTSITGQSHDGKFTSFVTGQEETGCP